RSRRGAAVRPRQRSGGAPPGPDAEPARRHGEGRGPPASLARRPPRPPAGGGTPLAGPAGSRTARRRGRCRLPLPRPHRRGLGRDGRARVTLVAVVELPAMSFKRLSTERVYSGRLLKIDRDRVELPNGGTTDLEMVR